MRLGKLGLDELKKEVLDKLEIKRKETIVSAMPGEDCAALNLDGTILVSADPITAKMPPFMLGSLSVDVCCNDIFACGGEPAALLLTIILPPSAPASVAGEIIAGAEEASKRLNVDIVGGHTEFSDSVTRPIVSAAVIGSAAKVKVKTDARAGDYLMVTKDLGQEGTVILAGEDDILLSKSEKTTVEQYAKSLSVATESRTLKSMQEVGFMHDITEGGLLGAICEVAVPNGLGAEIFEESFPVSSVTRRMCEKRGISPYRLLSSGSMLFSTSDPLTAIKVLEKAGVKCTQIGRLTDSKKVVFHLISGDSAEISAETDDYFNLKGNEKA